jgi:hypothetical protein
MFLVEKHRCTQRQTLRQQSGRSGSLTPGSAAKALRSVSGRRRLSSSGDGRGGADSDSDSAGEEEEEEEDEEHNRAAMRGMRTQFGGLSLADCLAAFTKEEKLEDESW